MRISEHPIIKFERGAPVAFTFDGKTIPAFDNETIAAALHAAGIRMFSRSMNERRPRGLYCAIGNCASCMMTVDGEENVKICIELVRDGMIVQSQKSREARI